MDTTRGRNPLQDLYVSTYLEKEREFLECDISTPVSKGTTRYPTPETPSVTPTGPLGPVGPRTVSEGQGE